MSKGIEKNNQIKIIKILLIVKKYAENFLTRNTILFGMKLKRR